MGELARRSPVGLALLSNKNTAIERCARHAFVVA